MTFAEERIKDVAMTIKENPTSIIIERTTKIPKGGGRSIEHTVLGPFIVRIFNQKGKTIQEVISNAVAGVKHTDTTYAFLADANADIKCSPSVMDEFTANGQKFRVTAVIPRYMNGVLTSLDGAMEVIE